RIKEYAKAHFPGMALDDTDNPVDNKVGVPDVRDLIRANPNLKGIICLSPPAFPAVAQAVEEERMRGDVHLVGLSLPSQARRYIKGGTVQTAILWNPRDLGYLTVYVADSIRKRKTKNEGTITAGRLGEINVRDGGEVILGPPVKFTAA